MSSYVFKPSRKVDGKSVRARTYAGRYRLAGELKSVQIALEVTDKQVAQSKLAAIVKQAEMERQGLAAPLRQIETLRMPLQTVVGEWIADLGAKGRKPHYCGIMGKFMGVFIRECRWTKVADIRPESFILWRGATHSKAPKTLNEYLGCVRAFLNWLVKSGRLPSNPLASVEKAETRGREVRNRRALSHDEFMRLLAAAGPVRAVASNSSGIFNGTMGTAGTYGSNITQSGSSGSFTYSVSSTYANLPVVGATWFDAARFTNWLGNGQGSGSMETGAYTLNGATSGIVTANVGATVYIPSENEWYKAAYYNGANSTYSLYPNGQNTITTGDANYVGSGTVDVGYGAASSYGTHGQGGNAWEWNDAVIYGSYRRLRGGSWNSGDGGLASSFRGITGDPSAE